MLATLAPLDTLEMLTISPTPIMQKSSDEPPTLIKGRAMPVNGKVPVTTAMLMSLAILVMLMTQNLVSLILLIQ